MTSIKTFAQTKLKEITDLGNYRKIRTIDSLPDNYVMLEGNKLLSFASNDYLGLKFNKEILESAKELAEDYATTGSSSRLLSGNYSLYNRLEDDIAKFRNYDACCVFGSGYLANIGTIPALANSSDLIIADKLIHASLIDGIKLSGAKFLRYFHNDLQNLEEILKINRSKYDKCMIITESIFGMDGNKADIIEINKLARKHDAWLIVDDAHGTGENIEKIDVLIGSLAKSFSSYGGYICADNVVIDYIKNKARSLIFTNSLPPYIVALSISALKYIIDNPNLSKLPLEKAKLFCKYLEIKETESHIVPIIIGDSYKTMQLAKNIENEGFLVSAIRHPSVPLNTARLRVSLAASHLDVDIEKFVKVMKKYI